MNETTAAETPTINVNLTKCNLKYPTAIVAHSDGEHPIGCPGAPVLVPLPLEPWRTVTMMEVGQHEAFLRLPLDLRKDAILAKACGPTAGDPREGGSDLPSARIMEWYVKHLIKQVGELS